MKDFHFHPGSNDPGEYPLNRFLPEFPSGCFKGWLMENLPPGAWIVDPFGMHPAMALEAARAGYRILVACNNPVLAHMYEVLASAPQAAQFQGVLADLAAEKKGDQRLEGFILSLYETKCPTCSIVMPARKFIWDRDRRTPVRLVVHCPECGGERELDVTDADLEKLRAIENTNLPRTWALERMGALSDDQQAIVQEAISDHPQRGLYVLFTLLNRAEAMALPDSERMLLRALLLSACDAANALWPANDTRARPLQLGNPPQFNEFNLWLKMEESIAQWCRLDTPVPLVKYPATLPETGGICLHPGRLRYILPLDSAIDPAAVVTILPRSNQAFWTLSALWSGWIFGKEAVTPIRSAFDRQRYDWHWQTQALYSTLTPLQVNLPDVPFFALLTDLAPGAMMAAIAGAQMSGWELQGISLRSDANLAQFLWKKAIAKPVFLETPMIELIRSGLEVEMKQRGEPFGNLEALAVALCSVVRERRLVRYDDQIPLDLLSTMQSNLTDALTKSGSIQNLGKEASPSQRSWFLAETDSTFPDFSERIEERLAALLESMNECEPREVDRTLCREFTGILAPAEGLLKVCLESYAEPMAEKPGFWKFREEDHHAARDQEIKETLKYLDEMAAQFKLEYQGNNPVTWIDQKGISLSVFYVSASTSITSVAHEVINSGAKQIFWILPGARVRLIDYRMQKNAHLADMLAGWRFIKFRTLRAMKESKYSELEPWIKRSESDPVDWEQSRQIPIF